MTSRLAKHNPLSAGKHGFMIGVHVLDNPYSSEPARTLWEKGYRNARRDWDQRFNPRRKFNELARRDKAVKATVFNIPARSRFVNKANS